MPSAHHSLLVVQLSQATLTVLLPMATAMTASEKMQQLEKQDSDVETISSCSTGGVYPPPANTHPSCFGPRFKPMPPATRFQRLMMSLNGADPDETQEATSAELISCGLTPTVQACGPWWLKPVAQDV